MIEILIVEDEKPISDLIRLNLMKAGYILSQTGGGEITNTALWQ